MIYRSRRETPHEELFRYSTVRIYDAGRRNVATIHLRSFRKFDEVYVLQGALEGRRIEEGAEVLCVSSRSLGRAFEIDNVIPI